MSDPTKVSDPRILGIGRPNLQLTTDFQANRPAVGTFTVHVEIPGLNPAEVTALAAELKNSQDTNDRTELKKALKKLLKDKNISFKGGHALINGLPDKPRDDDIIIE